MEYIVILLMADVFIAKLDIMNYLIIIVNLVDINVIVVLLKIAEFAVRVMKQNNVKQIIIHKM